MIWGLNGWMWTPTAARKDGKYDLYYPRRDSTNAWLICVTVADHPGGPIKDIGKPIDGLPGMDLEVFIDADGTLKMVEHTISNIKVKK